MKYYLGIDPGLSGALAFYDPLNDEMQVFDMPTHDIETNNSKRRKIDLHGLASLTRKFAPDLNRAIIEDVGAMPGQGVTSMFSFGFSAGCAQMALAAMQIRFETVQPRKWKQAMGLKKDKDESRRLASRLMPKHSHWWMLKKHDGRAEAALLAYYLFQQEKSILIPKKPTNDIGGMF